MERLIKFPYPKYCNCLESAQNLRYSPYCLCYQYDVDDNGYGAYGFNTIKSELVLKDLFNSLFYWNNDNIIEYQSLNIKSGLYFYNDDAWVKSEMRNICSYNISLRKTELLRRKGINVISEPTKSPLLFNIYDGSYKTDVLNDLLELNINLFISHLFTPEAGQSLILFDPSLILKIEQIAINKSIEFVKVKSIDELKSW